MLKFIQFILLLGLLTACDKKTCPHQKKEVSECLGDILWKELDRVTIEYDLEAVIDTMRKDAKGTRNPLTNPQTILAMHIEQLYEKRATDALTLAEDFLANLSLQVDQKTIIPQKLLYRVIIPGAGSLIKEKSSPLVHFTERDLDGEILSDTIKSNKPIRLHLAETILGFKLGVAGMQVGERREIYVHPDLAYKKLGKTKPNQLLIYDVTIVEE